MSSNKKRTNLPGKLDDNGGSVPCQGDITPVTEAILESISDGVFTVDRNWKILYFNRAAESITGIHREQAIGRPCSEVFRSSMCEEGCPLRQTMDTGSPNINRTGFIVDNQGNRIPVSVSTAVLRNSHGEIIGGAETFRDLSEMEALRREISGRHRVGDLVSRSPLMRRIFDFIPAVASSTSTLMIGGETGTGKELLARAVHGMSTWHDEPFVSVNCGALPDTLLESELFGYMKGAFTGAFKDKPGRLAQAGRGTLFLDEIGEISQAMQVRLLRVLQDRHFEPLGSTGSETFQARVITATHRNLEEMVERGEFRQDLYYRINVVRVQLPALRERTEDIPLLVEHFIERFNRIQGREIQGVTPECLDTLMNHSWPGNIRELENVIEGAFVTCREELIGVRHIGLMAPTRTALAPPAMTRPTEPPAQALSSQSQGGIAQAMDRVESETIMAALEKANYNRQMAADLLGIHKTTLHRKMNRLGIIAPGFRRKRDNHK